MKKIIFIAAIALLSLASCSKEHVCECNFTNIATKKPDSQSFTYTGKKSAAEDQCNQRNLIYANHQGSCELK